MLPLIRQPRVLVDEVILNPHRPLEWQVQVETKLRAEQLVRKKPLQVSKVCAQACAGVEEQVQAARTLDEAWSSWSNAAVAYYGGTASDAEERGQEVSTKEGALPVTLARDWYSGRQT
eukprot:3448608-Amphidinium_carterae.1